MTTLFTELISQLNSSVFVLLGILVLAGYALFKLGKWNEKFMNQDNRLTKVEEIHSTVIRQDERLQKVCDVHDMVIRQDERLKQVEELSGIVRQLSTKIDLIYTNTNPRSLVAAHSPLGVTKFGAEFADSTDARAVFERHLPKLRTALEASCSPGTNAYDIQQAALTVASTQLPEMLTAEEIDQFKQAAFNMGILYDDIWPLFGIWLRDTLLKARNIPIGDVDRHDPLHGVA